MKYNTAAYGVRLAYCLLINPLHSIRENCAELFIQRKIRINLEFFLEFSEFLQCEKRIVKRMDPGWLLWLVKTVCRQRGPRNGRCQQDYCRLKLA